MTYGKKYNRDMTGTEIAVAIRGDIKATVGAGELPPARYSVRLARSAGNGYNLIKTPSCISTA